MKTSPSVRLPAVGKTIGLLVVTLMPQVTYAVLPPDLIVSVGSQIAGFFSLLVAIFISIFASVGVLYIGWYERFKQYSVYIAFGLLAVGFVLSNGFYLWQLNHMASTLIPEYPVLTVATSTTDCHSCAFYSDSITLFIPDPNNPLVIELDMNRRQDSETQFVHYYFLHGIVSATALDRYAQFTSNDYVLQTNAFLTAIERKEPLDASVRDVFSGAVETATGDTVTFVTDATLGDFVTRNKPEQTQFQSVTQAEVELNGEVKTAYALIENLQSNNYQKRIFFSGMDSLQSLTHQFILWDEQGAFYMIDDSQVLSDTPAYPSHSWLLYKNANDMTTKKGFTTEIIQTESNQWSILVPDFSNGKILVTTINEYKKNLNGRSRYVVSGTVSDDNGTRTISGVLRLVR